MDEKFEEHLRKLEDPNYDLETNFALPENSTSLQKSKYELCQSILAYKQDKHLSIKETAKRLKLSVPETKEILLAHLDKFTLDRLMDYASQIFTPSEIKLTIKRKESTIHA